MGDQRYDDYRIAFRPRDDGTYDVVAASADGTTASGTFTMPFADDELEQSVLWIADTATRSSATREVAPADSLVLDAEHFGSALNDALLAGDVGAGYDTARATAAAHDRGLRLTLSLGEAPELLSVPWELLYRAPRFLASQRRTPLVRHLAVPNFPPPPAIDGAVHVLGIVASPTGLAALDVAAERSRVEAAVAPMVESGLVELDWLEPATPRRLREALRDGTYHVVHYVGHSDFTADGDGVLFLESSDRGTPSPLDHTELANLLADQSSLRLVVLNSCEGARTSLTDPFAGVATTLVQLGVPAVVAMQFSISDTAAILFAEELYINLIGRQAPIDAAVSEARKAIYIEQQSVEWATPVLFLGSTDVDLFEFKVTAAGLPPPVRADEPEPVPAVTPPPPVAPAPAEPHRSRRGLVAGIAAGVVAIAAVVAFGLLRGDDSDPAIEAAASTTAPAQGPTETASNASGPTAATEATGTFTTTTTGSTPAVPRPPAAPPEVFAGELTADEPAATLTFDAPARSIIDLSSRIDACTSQTYTLQSPSGGRVAAALTCSDIGRTELVESGTYAVVVEGNDSPGAYEIVLTRVPPDVTAPAPPDGRILGELTTVGERRIYTFDAAARDSIGVLSHVEQCGRMTWSVIDPSGNTVANALTCSDRPRSDLASSGTFRLVVDSNGAVGVYDLTLVMIPADVVQDVPSDGVMAGEITTVGARHTYLFTADAGTVIDLTAGTGACGSLMYTLTDANENVLQRALVCTSIGEVTLQQTGSYAIDVDAVSGVGAYHLTFREAG